MKVRSTRLEYISYRMHIPSYVTVWEKCGSADFVYDKNKGQNNSATSFLTSPWASHDDLLAWSRVRRLGWQYKRQQGGRCGMTGYWLWQRPPRSLLVSLRFSLPLPASRSRGGQDWTHWGGHRPGDGGAGEGSMARSGWCQGLGGEMYSLLDG